MIDVVIDQRFCGPKNSGNGGYSAGLFAQIMPDPAAVKLKRPPPLNTPIRLDTINGIAGARLGDDIIAEIEPSRVDIIPPPLPDDAAIQKAHDAFLSDAGDEHLLPFCFVCGNRRAHGDGLRLFTGPVEGSPVNADFWIPGSDLVGDDGLVRPEFLWAALDCPGAFAARIWPKITLLGRIAVDIRRRPAPGERLIAAAWKVRSDGRKHFADVVLLDEGRNIIAASNTLWIELSDERLIGQFKAERHN